jgi:lactoylglutathione lyase
MHLYATHLPVSDTTRSEKFYREALSLPFAHRDPTRDIVFLWREEKQKSMIGLRRASTGCDRQNGLLTRCHLAFRVSREQLTRAIEPSRQRGIETRGFDGKPCRERSVIGWMPSAQIYFRDPGGHSPDCITLLPESPKAGIIGSHAAWVRLNTGPPKVRS